MSTQDANAADRLSLNLPSRGQRALQTIIEEIAPEVSETQAVSGALQFLAAMAQHRDHRGVIRVMTPGGKEVEVVVLL